MIFSHTKTKGIAYTKLARWYNDITLSEFKFFNTISATIYARYPNNLNFFDDEAQKLQLNLLMQKSKYSDHLT